jgi:hypothetical protein
MADNEQAPADAADDTPAAGENAPEAAAPEQSDAPAPEAASPDALLSVFQTTQAESEDITLLLDLAGDVEIDDLLEELHTVAAALGIDTSPAVSFDDELLAA